MTSEPNSVDDLENAVDLGANGEVNGMPAETSAGEAEAGTAGPGDPDAHDAAPGDSAPPEPTEPAPSEPTEPAPPEPGPGPDDLLAQVASATQEIAAAADRYHARAEQREGVIDYLRSELDLLRRGERRGLLRPVLAEICRLRDDLLRQAGDTARRLRRGQGR